MRHALAFLLLATSLPAAAAEPLPDTISVDLGWLTVETVAFASTHDPSVIRLHDGRRLSVVYGGRANWETVRTWPVGMRLQLVYSPASGCLLLEPDSGFHLPVYDGFDDDHPLDRLLRQNLAIDASTLGMQEAYGASIALWEQEIARLHHSFQTSPQVPPAVRTILQQEHLTWQTFRDAHARARGEIYHLPQGTMWGVRAAEDHHRFTREQALRLLRWLDALAYADIAGWSWAD